jgi:hypothetical protein
VGTVRQLYYCPDCKSYFSETQNTPLAHLKTPISGIGSILQSLNELVFYQSGSAKLLILCVTRILCRFIFATKFTKTARNSALTQHIRSQSPGNTNIWVSKLVKYEPMGTMRYENIRSYYLPLEVAMKNAYHDEPGFWERWAEDF